MTASTQRRNQRPQACSECGAIVPAGAGSLWWEAAPDDGGDVLGRQPAGWRVSHLTDDECAAERARSAQQQAQAQSQRVNSFDRWLHEAAPLKVVQELPTPVNPALRPSPHPQRDGIYVAQQQYPLPKAYYRREADGYAYLGSFETYRCSNGACDAVATTGDDLTGWTQMGRDGATAACPAHAQRLLDQLASYTGGSVREIATGNTVARKGASWQW